MGVSQSTIDEATHQISELTKYDLQKILESKAQFPTSITARDISEMLTLSESSADAFFNLIASQPHNPSQTINSYVVLAGAILVAYDVTFEEKLDLLLTLFEFGKLHLTTENAIVLALAVMRAINSTTLMLDPRRPASIDADHVASVVESLAAANANKLSAEIVTKFILDQSSLTETKDVMLELVWHSINPQPHICTQTSKST
ncbi:hypothetical protein ScalyP_jg6094 [Parmales sp. scaly parma]|nr:hypothetical protein ScalyP_jg6094 [Parmales sp. scaly parma]